MENINEYIGIVHKFNGQNFGGCDCLGLCRLFYREHKWNPSWDDGKPITRDWEKKDPLRLARYLNRHFDMTRNPDKLSFGDILLFNVCGDAHLGIYLEYGDILAMQVPCVEGETTSTIYHRHYWEQGFKAGFRRRVSDER